MSDEECEAMIALGHDALDGRIIVDVQNGASRRDEHIRSSYSTFCEFSKTPQLAARESGVDPLPPGGQFLPHHDYFPATQSGG